MNCIKCEGLINDKSEKFINCDGCGKPIHSACSDLSAAELKCYELRPTSKRRMKYICVDCEQGMHQIPKMMGLIKELKEELRLLKEANVNKINFNTSGASPSSVLAGEEIISEIFERNKRAQNIIVYGSTEDGKSKAEQTQMDSTTINSLLSAAGLGEQNIKPIRLGKFDPTKENRSRPIKVRLCSPDDVHCVIKKFRTIKSRPNFLSLSVSFDRTPKQVSVYKLVKAELNNRIENGESNLKIRYHNGMPTIVRSQSEN